MNDELKVSTEGHNIPDVRFSTSIAAIAKALSAAQGKFKPIQKNCENPFFKSKYADLAGISEAVKDALVANEIAVTQIIIPDDEFVVIETFLLHSSGEWIKSKIALRPTKTDPQGMGSAITYARRYALAAILGVSAEDDDDANAASAPANGSKPAATGQPSATKPAGDKPIEIKNPDDPITEAQIKKLHAQAHTKNIAPEKMKSAIKTLFNKTSSKDLTKGQASTLIDMMSRDKLADAFANGLEDAPPPPADDDLPEANFGEL